MEARGQKLLKIDVSLSMGNLSNPPHGHIWSILYIGTVYIYIYVCMYGWMDGCMHACMNIIIYIYNYIITYTIYIYIIIYIINNNIYI